LNKIKTSNPIRTYRDFIKNESLSKRTRAIVRDGMIGVLSRTRSIDKGGIRFPYYHHVFDDEQKGFARQLKYMASIGDFISLNDAVTMLNSDDAIDGSYFCITFDDGFKNWATNAAPLLLDAGAIAAFFVVTSYIGTSIENDQKKLMSFYNEGDRLIEFLSWNDCRDLANAGMIIGSHTTNHVHLADLNYDLAKFELKGSKDKIEAELKLPCNHFCCPFGREGIDFFGHRHPKIAKELGYKSFLTGHRGIMRKAAPNMVIKRDHMLANWGDYQLKYFFST
tara:strand:+ start:696 stop:1535 length:840 start_codon:yes stop_codon:yes gene_type:complete